MAVFGLIAQLEELNESTSVNTTAERQALAWGEPGAHSRVANGTVNKVTRMANAVNALNLR